MKSYKTGNRERIWHINCLNYHAIRMNNLCLLNCISEPEELRKMKKNILLLTSTIKPNPDQPELNLTDPNDRLEDYKRALDFYSYLLGRGVVDNIVFVDNSGFDLKILSEQFKSNDIEWISFYGLDYPGHYHRGYGEFKLIDYAFKNSDTLQNIKDNDAVWKITGRYVVRNLKNFIRMAPGHFDIYCNTRNVWTELSVISWNRSGYEKWIKGIWEKFATGKVPELTLCEFLKEKSTTARGIIMKYYWPAYIIGRRGSDGTNFKGRFTPIRFGLNLFKKAIVRPFRFSE